MSYSVCFPPLLEPLGLFIECTDAHPLWGREGRGEPIPGVLGSELLIEVRLLYSLGDSGSELLIEVRLLYGSSLPTVTAPENSAPAPVPTAGPTI